MTPPSKPITTTPDLEALCRRLADAEFVAVDTEFIRDRTYFARPCLVQVATVAESAVIDPLALRDLGPLREVFLDACVLKVFHSGRQDLEIFHDLWGRVPAPLFDTQVAATVLGFGDQVGYAHLVQEVLGVALDKAGTMTDWSRRPLTEEQLRYAADDVVHLVTLYSRLREQLERAGRLAWLEPEFEALGDPALYRADPDEAWRQVKRSRSLKPEQRAVLRALAAWRETEARERDHPRRWVVSDEALLEIARRPPRRPEDLGRVRGISERWVAQYGPRIVELALEARGAVEDEVEAAAEAAPPERADEGVADALACVVRLRAQEHGISASLLATRAHVERVAAEGAAAAVPALSGWRRKVVGRDLLALLEGRLVLAVRDGRLQLEEA